MSALDLNLIERRFAAVAERAEALRQQCPYRFYGMNDDQISNWLDSYFIPIELGWNNNSISELEKILTRDVPDDFKLFLKHLGNLHGRLFGYDVKLTTPDEYVTFQERCLDGDCAADGWGEAVNDTQFGEMMTKGIFLSALGGFAVWYLAPQDNSESLIMYWDEGDKENLASIKTEEELASSVESRMAAFEWRTQHYTGLGGSLVSARGGQIPVGQAIQNELLEMPHKNYAVELSQDQIHRIKSVFSQSEL